MNIDAIVDTVTAIQKNMLYLQRDVQLKDGGKNFTTPADVAIEQELKEKLAPFGFGFLGEEGEGVQTGSRYMWIVDPIDGTSLFTMNGEYFSSSIALADKNEKKIIFGSVYQPRTGRQFVRTQDGIWLEEQVDLLGQGMSTIKRIPRPSRTQAMPELLACAFFPGRYDNPRFKGRLENVFAKETFAQLQRDYGIINARPGSGSSALFLCDIADGKRHAAILGYQSPWDLAVGTLYARDAGCDVVVLDDNAEPTTQDIEEAIATSENATLIHVAAYANRHVRSIIEKKLYAA